MQQIYHAENLIDANIVKGLLEQGGLKVYLGGYYLQGGVGELPAAGMTSLWVEDIDSALAQELIADYLVHQVTL